MGITKLSFNLAGLTRPVFEPRNEIPVGAPKKIGWGIVVG